MYLRFDCFSKNYFLYKEDEIKKAFFYNLAN